MQLLIGLQYYLVNSQCDLLVWGATEQLVNRQKFKTLST